MDSVMHNTLAISMRTGVAFGSKSFYDELQSYESGGIPQSEVTG